MKNDDKIKFDFGGDADFNPENIEVEETINAVFAFDLSSSMRQSVVLKNGSTSTRCDELNKAANEFVENMAKSHVKDRLLVSTIVFSDDVEVNTGFQPITEVDPFKFVPKNGMTALYGAARIALDKAIDYRDSLIKTGVKAKTILFIISDGENNASPESDAEYVKNKLKELNKEEQNIMTFSSVLLGIGEESSFKEAYEKLGFHALAVLGDDIRKAVSIISSSVTSVSNGQNISQNLNF
jgi:uncharacterized protein YegL